MQIFSHSNEQKVNSSVKNVANKENFFNYPNEIISTMTLSRNQKANPGNFVQNFQNVLKWSLFIQVDSRELQ